MKIYAAKVIWYPEDLPSIQDGWQGPQVDYMCVAAETFKAASHYIANYYGEDFVETIEITCVNADGFHIVIPEETYNIIKECDI